MNRLEKNMLRSAVNMAREARKNDKGFTLIELLIVIVILGVLAGIVVFSVNGITDKGDTAACKATVSSIDTAFEASVAQGGDSDATAVKVVDLGDYFHNGTAPTIAGKNTIGATDTVSVVDVATYCD